MVVDDNKGILKALGLLLDKYFDKVILISSPNRIAGTLWNERVDVVLLDMNFSAGINTGNEGIYWLSQIKKADANIQVVVFTAYADIDLAVRAIKEGAADFVVKPWENDKLIATLLSAYNLGKSKKVKFLKGMRQELSSAAPMFWGASQSMRQVRLLVDKVAATDANVLITGENGTGKEVLAREIHRLSSRAAELMVTVDMGALTESLFESELFGHVKGAFTDARTDRIGKFEIARGGTLFLDEIGNLSYHLQAKLLSAIQSRSIVRVGSNLSVPTDIRLICATNRNLPEMVTQKQFREDLLYRINTIELHIPPLRERGNDILLLADYFLDCYARKYKKKIGGLTRDAKTKLQSYAWPGNVRELQHAIERAVILSDGPMLRPENFMLHPAPAQKKGEPEELNLGVLEKEAIERALRRADGNITRAAELLGITRFALYRKLDKLGL